VDEDQNGFDEVSCPAGQQRILRRIRRVLGCAFAADAGRKAGGQPVSSRAISLQHSGGLNRSLALDKCNHARRRHRLQLRASR
jgi:hypothetical protein